MRYCFFSFAHFAVCVFESSTSHHTQLFTTNNCKYNNQFRLQNRDLSPFLAFLKLDLHLATAMGGTRNQDLELV